MAHNDFDDQPGDGLLFRWRWPSSPSRASHPRCCFYRVDRMRLQERTEHRATLRLVDATERDFADTQPAREGDGVDIDAVHRSHARRFRRQRRIDGWAVAGLLICVASAGLALGGAALLALQFLP